MTSGIPEFGLGERSATSAKCTQLQLPTPISSPMTLDLSLGLAKVTKSPKLLAFNQPKDKTEGRHTLEETLGAHS